MITTDAYLADRDRKLSLCRELGEPFAASTIETMREQGRHCLEYAGRMEQINRAFLAALELEDLTALETALLDAERV